jgi:hypothetical protein
VDSTGGTESMAGTQAAFLQKHVHMGHVHTDPGTDFDTINRLILSVKATGAGRMIPALLSRRFVLPGSQSKRTFEQKIHPPRSFGPEPINIRIVGDNYSFRHIPAWQVLDGGSRRWRSREEDCFNWSNGRRNGRISGSHRLLCPARR